MHPLCSVRVRSVQHIQYISQLSQHSEWRNRKDGRTSYTCKASRVNEMVTWSQGSDSPKSHIFNRFEPSDANSTFSVFTSRWRTSFDWMNSRPWWKSIMSLIMFKRPGSSLQQPWNREGNSRNALDLKISGQPDVYEQKSNKKFKLLINFGEIN